MDRSWNLEIRQLEIWGIFNPISEPLNSIYDEIYSELSKDVHVIHDRTDIGTRLLLGEEPFERPLLRDSLVEYVSYLHRVGDLGLVILLNIMSDFLNEFDEPKSNLKARLPILEHLGMQFASIRAKKFVGNRDL